MCLKLHAYYHDTGAIIAATTTSIPEALHTERAWDYRFCWLRDAAFVVEALRRIGHLNEGEQFLRFLLDVAQSGPLQPLYAIDGGRETPEQILGHLAGYRNASVVRVGNAASVQKQNDLMGEIVLCLETMLTDPRIVVEDVTPFLPLLESLVEDAITAAPTKDTSIWEFRTMFNVHTFSRAHVRRSADPRARRRASRDRPRPVAKIWPSAGGSPSPDPLRREIVLTHGYSTARGMFTQALDGQHADASMLLLPMIGLVDGRDPRFMSTVEVFEGYPPSSSWGTFMRRYKNDDDFGETTKRVSTICSFWWAEALALMGRLDDAVTTFNRVASYANEVGLFSEDVDPETGELLGNFP